MKAVTNVRHAQTTSSKLALSVLVFRRQSVLCCSLGCAAGLERSKCWIVGWRLACPWVSVMIFVMVL